MSVLASRSAIAARMRRLTGFDWKPTSTADAIARWQRIERASCWKPTPGTMPSTRRTHGSGWREDRWRCDSLSGPVHRPHPQPLPPGCLRLR